MYCRTCGKPLDEGHVFCPSCGTKKETQPPPKETKLKKFEIIGNKIAIIMGIFVLLTGIVGSNLISAIMGIVIFSIGFVSMKTNSKTIRQLIGFISVIITAVAIINLTTLW